MLHEIKRTYWFLFYFIFAHEIRPGIKRNKIKQYCGLLYWAIAAFILFYCRSGFMCYKIKKMLQENKGQ